MGYTGVSESLPFMLWGKANRSKAKVHGIPTCHLTQKQQGSTSGKSKKRIKRENKKPAHSKPSAVNARETREGKMLKNIRLGESGDSEKKWLKY